MKGIIMAGGTGSRLYPLTLSVSKQLLPVYDKPMIYYPLSVLMLAGIRDILIISTHHDLPLFQRLLQDGHHLGINIHYAAQNQPNGIAEGLIIGRQFIHQDPVALILGDNIYFGESFKQKLHHTINTLQDATIFVHQVSHPENFGIVNFDAHGDPIDICEKPTMPKSNYAVTGLYFYHHSVTDIAQSLKPSSRGELEITDINRLYLQQGKLNIQMLGRGFTWLDTGTPDSLLEAAQLIHTIEKRQGMKIACLEEIAYRQGWINTENILQQIHTLKSGSYQNYLKQIIQHS